MHNVCLKANRKLAILISAKMLKRNTLDLLYKLTVRSCIDYALPVYYHSLKITEKAKLAKIQYTAGKIVSGALHLTGKETLNAELAWESIQVHADFLGLSIFHKIAKNETRPLIRDYMPEQVVAELMLSDMKKHMDKARNANQPGISAQHYLIKMV